MNLKKIQAIIKKNKYEFIHMETTVSTMNDVKNFLDSQNQNCILLSNQQTAGKGRRGNIWHSPKGNIYCSISFENCLDIRNHFLFSIMTSVTIKMALEVFNANNIKFKWPNDIFFENQKFSGIILESHKVNEKKTYMIVGFGININSSPAVLEYSTTYVKKFCKIKNLEEFLLVFFKILFSNWNLLKKNHYSGLVNIYTKSLMFLGERITVKINNNSSISGIFKGVNIDGSMQLLKKNNSVSNLYNGTIEI